MTTLPTTDDTSTPVEDAPVEVQSADEIAILTWLLETFPDDEELDEGCDLV